MATGIRCTVSAQQKNGAQNLGPRKRIRAQRVASRLIALGLADEVIVITAEKPLGLTGLPALDEAFALDAVDGIDRIRFTSPHPKDLRPETIAAMAECASVCEHAHLPLQSGSTRILKAMQEQADAAAEVPPVTIVAHQTSTEAPKDKPSKPDWPKFTLDEIVDYDPFAIAKAAEPAAREMLEEHTAKLIRGLP